MTTTVIGRSLVLSHITELVDNAGVIGYLNVANVDNISVTSQTLENPITNIVNPATAFTWKAADNGNQVITINTDTSEIDYVGLARHNLNQLGLTIEIAFNGLVVIPARSVSNNQALMFLTSTAAPGIVTVTISGATTAAIIGVLYIGKSIRLERNIYVGHTPITYGRQRSTVNPN
jgi:hypothetical protein